MRLTSSGNTADCKLRIDGDQFEVSHTIYPDESDVTEAYPNDCGDIRIILTENELSGECVIEVTGEELTLLKEAINKACDMWREILASKSEN